MNIADMSLEQRNKKMRNIFIMLIGGFFGIMMVANVIMVSLATGSWNGVTETNHYERGLAYNKLLANAKKQTDMGWNVGFEFKKLAGNNGMIATSFSDKNNNPLKGMNVEVIAVRPTNEGFDYAIKLHHMSDSIYSAKVNFPLAGQWELRLLATAQNGDTFKQSKRIDVR